MIVVTGETLPGHRIRDVKANISARSCQPRRPTPRRTIGRIRDAAQGGSMADVGALGPKAEWPLWGVQRQQADVRARTRA
jgi:hypothetical protein